MQEKQITLRFRALLKALDKSVSDMCTEIGGTSSKYYKLYNGEVEPNFSTIDSILTKYDTVSAEWFLRGKGNMFLPDNDTEYDEEKENLKKRVRQLEAKLSDFILTNEVNVFISDAKNTD